MTGNPYTDAEIEALLAGSPQLTEFLAASATNANRPAEPDDINDLRARAATASYNAEALTARWSAVVNDEVGGWAVSTNGLGPLDGGRMAAELVMTRELAEHTADVHNQWLARQHMGVPVATGFITTVDASAPPMWRSAWRWLRRRGQSKPRKIPNQRSRP